MKRENPTIEICPGNTRRTVANGKPRNQRRAAPLARSFFAQSARNSFISALSPRMRGATPFACQVL